MFKGHTNTAVKLEHPLELLDTNKFREYFISLDVSPSVTPEELDAAYKKKAFETHPKRNPGKKEAFLKVVEAYEALTGVKNSHEFWNIFGDVTEEKLKQWHQAYQVLGIPFCSPGTVVAHAYRRQLLRQFPKIRPDQPTAFPQITAEFSKIIKDARFLKIANAYDTLTGVDNPRTYSAIFGGYTDQQLVSLKHKTYITSRDQGPLPDGFISYHKQDEPGDFYLCAPYVVSASRVNPMDFDPSDFDEANHASVGQHVAPDKDAALNEALEYKMLQLGCVPEQSNVYRWLQSGVIVHPGLKTIPSVPRIIPTAVVYKVSGISNHTLHSCYPEDFFILCAEYATDKLESINDDKKRKLQELGKRLDDAFDSLNKYKEGSAEYAKADEHLKICIAAIEAYVMTLGGMTTIDALLKQRQMSFTDFQPTKKEATLKLIEKNKKRYWYLNNVLKHQVEVNNQLAQQIEKYIAEEKFDEAFDAAMRGMASDLMRFGEYALEIIKLESQVAQPDQVDEARARLVKKSQVLGEKFLLNAPRSFKSAEYCKQLQQWDCAFEIYFNILRDKKSSAEEKQKASLSIAELIINGDVCIDSHVLATISSVLTAYDATTANRTELIAQAIQAYEYVAPYTNIDAGNNLLERLHWQLAGQDCRPERTLPWTPQAIEMFAQYYQLPDNRSLIKFDLSEFNKQMMAMCLDVRNNISSSSDGKQKASLALAELILNTDVSIDQDALNTLASTVEGSKSTDKRVLIAYNLALPYKDTSEGRTCLRPICQRLEIVLPCQVEDSVQAPSAVNLPKPSEPGFAARFPKLFGPTATSTSTTAKFSSAAAAAAASDPSIASSPLASSATPIRPSLAVLAAASPPAERPSSSISSNASAVQAPASFFGKVVQGLYDLTSGVPQRPRPKPRSQ